MKLKKRQKRATKMKEKKKEKERMEKNATVRKFELFVEIFSRTKKKLKTVLTDSSFSFINFSHFERQDLLPLLPASSFTSSFSLTL